MRVVQAFTFPHSSKQSETIAAMLKLFIVKPFSPANVAVLRGRPTECQKERDDRVNFRQQDIDANRDVPQCKPDGSYDDIQCSAATGECWCVFYNNIEIRGTRTQGKPNCPPTGNTLEIKT